ncbi:MAG: A/G-specific adenine glycosylase [Chitinophagales bacterium]|jgi:A/G-specific adenine glycosylase
MKSKKINFRKNLMLWHKVDNDRQMPWKEEQDPYKVWLSEIILQQTRVEQGLSYYHAFLDNFPTIHDLAEAEEDEVLRLWQGLGYYSRARNLHFTAKDIVQNYQGQFPSSFEGLLKLKGVGRYTAAAIASFVFKEPVAVVDGNVIRVLSRFFAIETPYDTSKGRKEFEELANQLLDHKAPDRFNQAIMDFGATICKPKKPLCEECVLQKNCSAYLNKTVSKLPVKKNRIVSRSRFFIAFHLEEEGEIAIEQRVDKDIWQGLYQLPWLEVDKFEKNPHKQIERILPQHFDSNTVDFEDYSDAFVQQLSHQKIHVIFVKTILPKVHKIKHNYIYARNLTKFAFPKIFILYLRGKSLLLD